MGPIDELSLCPTRSHSLLSAPPGKAIKKRAKQQAHKKNTPAKRRARICFQNQSRQVVYEDGARVVRFKDDSDVFHGVNRAFLRRKAEGFGRCELRMKGTAEKAREVL